MLTYLYIAVGGAIGSVGRAWITIVMTRLVGADFPWGTIFINISGSFVIGFFAALTASDGRFQVPADLRTFVMVGLCGGFTTFSSFSLQTLDLLRDGKPTAALANIAVSVVLCLFAVAAGYAGAIAINDGWAKTETAQSPEALPAHALHKSALAVLDAPESVPSVLSSAARLAPGGHIQALAVRMPPIPELMIADEPISGPEEHDLREKERAWARALRARVGAWEERQPPQTRTDFIEEEGDAGFFVKKYGRDTDVIVVPGGSHTSRARHALHAGLFATSRPLLVSPPQSAGEFGRVVVVAWKDDIRAPKAVVAAIPLLAGADAVHILCANADNPALPPLFAEHGIRAQIHAVEGPGPVGRDLLQKAHELGADLIVMGAYGRGEWREALLGGVTRYMLAHADLPLFMRHQ